MTAQNLPGRNLSMLDRLTVLTHALGEGRHMFRDRAALERHQERLAAEHLRWVAAHSPYTAERFQQAKLGRGPVAGPAPHRQSGDDGEF